jgi:hypothetical protein
LRWEDADLTSAKIHLRLERVDGAFGKYDLVAT